MRLACFSAAGVCLAALSTPVWALTEGPVASGPPALSARVRTLEPIRPELDDARQEALRRSAAWTLFVQAQDGRWHVDFDLDSGRPRRMLGRGIPLLPGERNTLTVGDLPGAGQGPVGELTPQAIEAALKGFLAQWPDLFRLDPAQWRLAPEATLAVDGGRLQYAALDRLYQGVPVTGARLSFAIKQGNLIYVHGTFLDDLSLETTPRVSPAEALRRSLGELRIQPAATRRGPSLEILPVPAADGVGREFRLVWRQAVTFPGYHGTWVSVADARTGEVLELYDDNSYLCNLDATEVQGRVQGGVKPAQATDAEELEYFPFTEVELDGLPAVTDYNGWYFYDGSTAVSTLSGEYFDVTCRDGCSGQPLASSTTDGYIDFGFGGRDQMWNGYSTPADRTAFYHLNVARAMGAKWLDLPWLSSNVGVNVNIADICNAFWNGVSVNFFRSGCGSICCGNTGEIRDVMQHEWGHGLDGNDGSGPGGRATGEAIGDKIALFVDHDSCIGQSFGVGRDTGPYCLSVPDCASTDPCSGVRNVDEKRASRGLLTVSDIRAGRCSPAGGCPGDLGGQCHCEGEVWGQAGFHLIMNFLTGVDYASGAPLAAGNPAYPDASAWYTHERLFFQSLPVFRSYASSRDQSIGTSAYDAYAVVDDDDADLSNGTPNAEYINQAFMHHGIHETPINLDSANCTPPADPDPALSALISSEGRSQVEVSWSRSATAAFYNVYRTERLGDVWLPVRENVLEDGSPGYVVYDEPVRNSETYYYLVLAVAASGCVSPGSNTPSIAVALPELDVSGFSIDDAAPGGDGDGLPEPGESVRLSVELTEVAGFAGAAGVSATLESTDPLVSILSPGPVGFPDFAPSATHPGGMPFEVYITLSHGCDSEIPLALLVNSDDGCWAKALKLVVPPAPACVPAAAAEAAFESLGAVVDNLDPSCTDDDGLPDNDEDSRLTINVINAGSLPARNVSVELSTSSPYVAITSPNPLLLPGSLAGSGRTSADFDFTVTGAPCNDRADFVALVTSDDNVAPVSGRFSLPLEEDRAITDMSVDFEADLGGWTAVGFARSTRRAVAGSYSVWAGEAPGPGHCDGSGSVDGSGLCASLVSPPITPTAATQLVLSTWFQIEAPSGGQYWDRANVHVIDPVSHTLIAPVTGRPYTGGAGDETSLCHIDVETGWAGTGGGSWATSTFDLSPWAGQEVQVEINYNTDAAEICEGIYIDNIFINDLVSRSCDTNLCSSVPEVEVEVESCSFVDSCPETGASDGVVDPGDRVTYSLRFRNVSDFTASDFQADVTVSGGGSLVSGGSVGGSPRVDIAARAAHDHMFLVDAEAGCGATLDVDVLDMHEATASFGNELVACDYGIGASVPAGTTIFEAVPDVVVPDDPEAGPWSELTASEPAPVDAARVGITVVHLNPSSLLALLYGPSAGVMDVSAAIGASLDITSFYNGQGAGVYILHVFDSVTDRRSGRLERWRIEVDHDARSSCTTCVSGVCDPPSLEALASVPSACVGQPVVLTSDLIAPGTGMFSYRWDFGDATSSDVFSDPTLPVPHSYAATGGYSATLVATKLSDASCTASDSVSVSVASGIAPTGDVGNRLRSIKVGRDVVLDWTGATVSPPSFAVHKTTDKMQVAETASGIGDEPRAGLTSGSGLIDARAVTIGLPFYYEVLPADSCGITVFP